MDGRRSIHYVIKALKSDTNGTIFKPMQKASPRYHPAKYIIGGLIIVVTIGALIFLATKAETQYFLTVDELLQKGNSIVDKKVRISGAVIGDSIEYNPSSFTLKFKIANVSGDLKAIDAQGGLAAALHAAVIDPSRTQLQVVYHGIKPDLLKNEAQAILTGQLSNDGTFNATEILLKCPTKYAEELPNQTGK
jgi:cytochrome c-type biogenesis protein CcmE